MSREEGSDEELEDSRWRAENSGVEDGSEDVEDTAGSDDGSGQSDKAARHPCTKPSRQLPPRPPGASLRTTAASRPSQGPPVRPSRPAMSRLQDANDDDEEQLTEAALQKRREENIRALVNNSLQTCRQPLLSKFLTVMEGEMALRKPFQSPMQGAPAMSDALRRKLAARRHFVPWGSSTPLPIPTMPTKPAPATLVIPEPPSLPEPAPAPPEPVLPEGIEPLVLWQAPPGCPEGPPLEVAVDNMLVRFLRPHQREGVQFMFDCVTGQRLEGKQGCILADDMGLGKTLQGITLLWTLLTGGHPLLGGAPIARRAIIVCPTSLVSNWDNECTKWLQGRLKTLAMCESSREDVVANIGMFLHPSNVYKVLIISYETFRMHAERFQVPHACDLLVCDEAHRLKNDATLTNRALDNLPCKRRVLLSGTPMQNHLDEFFAMVDFCNPGVLGPPAQFRKHYELPILAGREPDAAPEEAVLGEERSRELSGLTNNFILRRTNKLLSQHLPPKVIEVVCCRLTDLQRQLYCHFLQSKAARRVLNGRTSGVLSAITSLKKLCNHPKLIYDAVHSKVAAAEEGEGGRAEGFEDVGSLFPPGLFDNGRAGRGGMAHGWEAVSGKMAVLARMLHVLYTETNDRIVLVSNYTSSLDLFAQLCRERGYPFVRLDGTTTINKRQKLVKVFNDPAERQFAFLLSSKAGGCGLNLIGANRLVLFDPDWNPANDQQAAARVWRDGQRKRVFVYRFLSTGSIEEKVYQRQLSKEGLKQLVSKNGKAAANIMTAEDLRELFTLHADTWSDTYDCMCGGPGAAGEVPPLAAAAAAAGSDVTGDRAGAIDLAGDDDTHQEEDDEDDDLMEERRNDKAAERKAVSSGGGGAASGGGGSVVVERPAPVYKRQAGEPAEEDLCHWAHHPTPDTVPDAVMRRVAAPDVSFIFSCSVAGKAIEGGDEEEQRLAAGANGATAGAASGGALGRSASGTGRVALAAPGRGVRGSSRAAIGTGTPAPTPSAAARAAPAAAVCTPMPTLFGPAPGVAGGLGGPAGKPPLRSGTSSGAAQWTPAAAASAPPAATTSAAAAAAGPTGVASRPPLSAPRPGASAATGISAQQLAARGPGVGGPATGQQRQQHPQAEARQAVSTGGPGAAAVAAGSVEASGPGTGGRPLGLNSAVTQAVGGRGPGVAASVPAGRRPPGSVTGAVVSNPSPGNSTGARADGQPKPPGPPAAPQPARGLAPDPRPASKPPAAPRPPATAPHVQGCTGDAAGGQQGQKRAAAPAGGGPGALAGGKGPQPDAARGGGGGGAAEVPQAKRPRAPGWYIDDDDDFFR